MTTIKDILDKPEAIYNGDSSKITFYTVTVIEKTGKQLFIKTAFQETESTNAGFITLLKRNITRYLLCARTMLAANTIYAATVSTR